jgi:hypothetical protein
MHFKFMEISELADKLKDIAKQWKPKNQ